MADSEEPSKTPGKKRQLKQAPTIREQAEKEAKKAEKKAEKQAKKSTKTSDNSATKAFLKGFFAPLRFVGKVLKFIGRFTIPPYFRNSWKELRQTSWPKLKESRRLTTAVIIFSIVFGAIVALLDFGLDKIFKQILLK